MNCISCGQPIETNINQYQSDYRGRFCDMACKVKYNLFKFPERDKSKIYEVSNVDIEVIL